MTIRSWITLLAAVPAEAARLHGKLRISKPSARYERILSFANVLRLSFRCAVRPLANMTSASGLKALRLTHHYVGVFFAPTILFFAITGGLQMFGLHETSRGSSYVPPAILVHLSQLHKKGTLYLPPRKATPPASAKADGPKPDTPKSDPPKSPPPTQASPAPSPLPMKVFFGATALALAISTCTGLFMSWKYARRKALVGAIFLAGFVCLTLLLLL